MSMLKTTTTPIALAAILAVPGFAQESGGADVPRTVAELPDRLPETNEREPGPVPDTSAEDIGEIAPDAFVFGVGHRPSQEQIAAIDIDVMPGGAGAPSGSGTYAQGREVYAQYCASCHMEDLSGNTDLGAAALVGGRGTLDTDSPRKTVESYWPHASTLFDYLHRAMPINAPGSLTDQEYYAVSAYILGQGGIVGEDFELNADTFGEIEMPNADGFVSDPRPDAQ